MRGGVKYRSIVALAAMDSSVKEEVQGSLLQRLVSRRRLTLVGIIFGVEIVIFFAAMLYPISPADQQSLLQQARATIDATTSRGPLWTTVSIIANNLRVALLEMIPVAGAFLFAYSIFVTGQTLQAFAISYNIPAPLIGLILFFLPYAVVELAAYAVAVSSGTMLVISWRHGRLVEEFKVFVLEIGVVAAILTTAAVMETATIQSPLLGFALWVPIIMAVGAVAALRKGGKNE